MLNQIEEAPQDGNDILNMAAPAGVHFLNINEPACRKILEKLCSIGLDCYTSWHHSDDSSAVFSLLPGYAGKLTPSHDTSGLSMLLNLNPARNADDLEREIVLAMLAAPLPLTFPSYEEFIAALRMRCHIVWGARRTQLAFHTSEAERPADYWTYASGRGFIVLPGKSLICALEKATQPETSAGKLYSFSCYRATEYVILLGITRVLAELNPALLERIQAQWEQRPIMSGEFHQVFLHEYGSMSQPLPPDYYIPGDRVWFRNPDEKSSDVSGYEGSWVIYLGEGFFSNLWNRDRPYTLQEKCVEIFHWRHAVYIDEEGEPRIDEQVVAELVRQTMVNKNRLEHVLRIMKVVRDPKGIHAKGGCIDATREFPRYICEGTADLIVPR